MKRAITGLIAVLFLVLSNASEVGEYKPYPGLRLFVNNDFMKTSSHTIMVNLLKSLPTLLNYLSGTLSTSLGLSVAVGIWPLEVNITVASVSAGPIDIDGSKGDFRPGNVDGSFSFALRKTCCKSSQDKNA